MRSAFTTRKPRPPRSLGQRPEWLPTQSLTSIESHPSKSHRHPRQLLQQRQKLGRNRTLPLSRKSRHPCRSFQSAKHVQQQCRNPLRRRNRESTSSSSGGIQNRSRSTDEPRPPQTGRQRHLTTRRSRHTEKAHPRTSVLPRDRTPPDHRS